MTLPPDQGTPMTNSPSTSKPDGGDTDPTELFDAMEAALVDVTPTIGLGVEDVVKALMAQLPRNEVRTSRERLIEHAASLLTSQAERIAELEKERDEWRAEYERRDNDVRSMLDKFVSTEARLQASEAARLKLVEGLRDALEGWEYAAEYKGEYLLEKHGDAEDIERLRALLHSEQEQKDQQP